MTPSPLISVFVCLLYTLWVSEGNPKLAYTSPIVEDLQSLETVGSPHLVKNVQAKPRDTSSNPTRHRIPERSYYLKCKKNSYKFGWALLFILWSFESWSQFIIFHFDQEICFHLEDCKWFKDMRNFFTQLRYQVF